MTLSDNQSSAFYLYLLEPEIRFLEAAVEHLFAVTSGLDSAVIGEAQVLGQVRRAYSTAEANHTVGRTLPFRSGPGGRTCTAAGHGACAIGVGEQRDDTNAG